MNKQKKEALRVLPMKPKRPPASLDQALADWLKENNASLSISMTVHSGAIMPTFQVTVHPNGN